jgi:uncharacterized iron-regulated membrane protein
MTTNDLLEHPTAAPEPAPRAADGWSLRPLLLRLHFYAGVLVGPFVLVAALTGLLYIFTPQLEDAIYDHELHVPASEQWQPLSAQIAAARQALPEATVSSVRPAPSPTDTTQILFTVSGLPESYHRTVFIDPHTSEVRGVLDTYGSGQALPLRTWLDQLHRNLHLGDVGRVYSELAASWLWVVVAGGLVLWWGRRRRRRSTGERCRTMSRHAVTGTAVAVVLLFLSATGLTWSQFAGSNIGDVRSALNWQTPTVSAAAQHHGPEAGAAHGGHSEHAGRDIGPDAVLAAARDVGLSGPVEITLPTGAGSAYVVAQIQRHWPEKQDSAAVDPMTGQVTEVLRFADYPLMAKLARWGIDAHMGLLFGLFNQIVLAVVCVALIAMIVWGYRMWWLRRPTRTRFGRPYPRGSLRRLPLRVLVPLIAITVVVGWFLPVFGLSLLAFLAVDVLLGRRGGQSERRRYQERNVTIRSSS